MLKLVVLVALVAAVNGASCPAVCSTCFAGGAGGGTSLVGGVCHASCSTSRYCGTSDAYTNGGTDCTGCAETPTAAQRANLKLADAHFVTNTKASITAAESLYKQTVVEFSALFNAGSLLTKSAKMRYNYLLDLDSRKPAAEQALLCVDNCSPTGTWVPPANDPTGCPAGGIYAGMNYCTWASGVGSGSNPYSLCGQTHMEGGGGKCQKTCGTCADKTPYAASELSSLLGRRSNDQCSDGEQNGDETGVDCGGSCSVCPVDCVSSETTCTCTPACGNTCDCTDTITITTPAAGRGQACPSGTVRTFAGAACGPTRASWAPEGARCAKWAPANQQNCGGNSPPLTDPTDPLYSVDKIQECANRCSALAASGATVHSGSSCSRWVNGVIEYVSDPIAYSSKAFTIYRPGDCKTGECLRCNCASAEDDCAALAPQLYVNEYDVYRMGN